MVLFYKFGKKDGLFLYISLMAVLLNLFMFKSVDILSFQVDFGISFVMGIFICGNVIVQRYGIDEVKDIIKAFVVPYVITMFILSLVSLTGGSEYNIITNESYNSLFSYLYLLDYGVTLIYITILELIRINIYLVMLGRFC